MTALNQAPETKATGEVATKSQLRGWLIII